MLLSAFVHGTKHFGTLTPLSEGTYEHEVRRAGRASVVPILTTRPRRDPEDTFPSTAALRFGRIYYQHANMFSEVYKTSPPPTKGAHTPTA